MNFTSKDKSLVILFKNCPGLRTKVSPKLSGCGNLSYHTQFGDVLFYQFLVQIGLSPAKSKTIVSVDVLDKYFADFLRGYFDGDGTSYSFYDSIFPRSYRFYVSFISASPPFMYWLQERLEKMIAARGHFSRYSNADYVQLKYAKKEAIILIKYMYYIKTTSLSQKEVFENYANYAHNR